MAINVVSAKLITVPLAGQVFVNISEGLAAVSVSTVGVMDLVPTSQQSTMKAVEIKSPTMGGM